MIYSIMDDMTRIDVPVNHEKNSLEIGRVLLYHNLIAEI